MERVETAELRADAFTLILHGPNGNESLRVVNAYPDNDLSRFLFLNFGTMHLVAPYLPRTIKTRFGIDGRVQNLISAMYDSEGEKPPKFESPRINHTFRPGKSDPRKVAVADSSGKDSVWNLWWAQKGYGADNVLAVHIGGLNRSNASGERKYFEAQEREFSLPHAKIIELQNGSIETG